MFLHKAYAFRKTLLKAVKKTLEQLTMGAKFSLICGADLHLFQTRFVIGWENKRDVDITMPISLKTDRAGFRDQ